MLTRKQVDYMYQQTLILKLFFEAIYQCYGD